MYVLPDPRSRGKPATKAGSCTLVTLLPGLEVPDATESYCEVLLYFSSLEVEDDEAWLLL